MRRDATAQVLTTLTLATALVGCIDEPRGSEGTGGASSSTSATTTMASSEDSLSASGGFVTTAAEGDSTTEGGDTTFGGGFIYGGPDWGGPVPACDPLAQECNDGEKCVPWANDGGAVWNYTRCAPIDDTPDQVGDPCTAEGSGVSGIDSCDFGSICWDVDPDTLEGTCVAQCGGTWETPLCEDPDTACMISNNGFLTLCLDVCVPTLQDCPADQGCYPHQRGWACIPDASADMGAYGEECEQVNLCDPGLVCADAAVVAGCPGSVGCCTEVCDLSDPAGDAQCTGQGAGETCLPVYEAGMAPAGYEDVGICALAGPGVLDEPVAAVQ